jgi:formylglycine-generating enzyme required for sulfatase activity
VWRILAVVVALGVNLAYPHVDFALAFLASSGGFGRSLLSEQAQIRISPFLIMFTVGTIVLAAWGRNEKWSVKFPLLYYCFLSGVAAYLQIIYIYPVKMVTYYALTSLVVTSYLLNCTIAGLYLRNFVVAERRRKNAQPPADAPATSPNGKSLVRTFGLVFAISIVSANLTSLLRNGGLSPTRYAGPEMVRIPAGTFAMGCSPGDSDCDGTETPGHQVTVKSFWMDATPVTSAAYFVKTRNNPSHFNRCAFCPVENVSWYDANRYCLEAKKRLPTEAEWEYAARGGTRGPQYDDLDLIAWYDDNSGRKSHPVGQKKPNAYGLYDMLGNVWEWCSDWFDREYYKTASANDPRGPDAGEHRVARGGSWVVCSRIVRASTRVSFEPDHRENSVGFRCVRDVTETDFAPPTAAAPPATPEPTAAGTK